MKYAKILQARLDDLGMTKQQLSDQSGVPYTTVSNLFARGAARAGLRNVFAICRVLGIDPGDLFRQAEPGEMSETMTPEHQTLCDAYDSAPEMLKEAALRVLDTGKAAANRYSLERQEEVVNAFMAAAEREQRERDERIAGKDAG